MLRQAGLSVLLANGAASSAFQSPPNDVSCLAISLFLTAVLVIALLSITIALLAL